MEFVRQFTLLILLCSCSHKRIHDESMTNRPDQDTIVYPRLPEPPPLRVEYKHTDSSLIDIKYDEELDYIREFNRLDSFDVTYYKDFSFRTKKIREVGTFIGGNEKGIWKYYDSTGALIRQQDFGSWNKWRHLRDSLRLTMLYLRIKEE